MDKDPFSQQIRIPITSFNIKGTYCINCIFDLYIPFIMYFFGIKCVKLKKERKKIFVINC